MSGASARCSCPHVPVETSTPPNQTFWDGQQDQGKAPGPSQKGRNSSLLHRTAQKAARWQAEKNFFAGKASEKMISILFAVCGQQIPRSWVRNRYAYIFSGSG